MFRCRSAIRESSMYEHSAAKESKGARGTLLEGAGSEFPSIEENVSVMKQHRAYNRKTGGFTLDNSGPAMETLHRKKLDGPVHQNEHMGMKAMGKIFAGGRKTMASMQDASAKTWNKRDYSESY